jgi:hypothetical protein
VSSRRKIVLAAVLTIVVGAHIALFAAGGTWRRAGFALLAVDVVSAWFVFAAVREVRNLDKAE